MTNNHGTAGKILKRFFQCSNSLNIKVVCRFVEQKNVSSFFEHHAKIQAVLFTTRKHTNLFILIRPNKIEPATVSMSVYFANTTFKRTALFVYSTKLNNICTTTKSFVNSFVLIKTRTHLININKFYSLTDFNFASIRFFTTSLTSRINNHLEQCSFTRTVRTNNTNNGTSRNMKIKIFKKKLVAK